MASAVRTRRCSSDEDVVARGDAELERVLRRESQLVDGVQVAGIGHGDLQHVAVDGIRDRHGALERLHGNELGGVEGNPDGRQVDDREVVAHGQHPGDASRASRRPRRSAPASRACHWRSVHERGRERRSDECRVLEQVEQELGRLVDAERRRERAAGRRRVGRGRPELIRGLWAALVVICGSSKGLSARAESALDASRSEEAEIRVEDLLAEEQRDDRAERQERDERHAHLPRRCAVPGDDEHRRRARGRRTVRS